MLIDDVSSGSEVNGIIKLIVIIADFYRMLFVAAATHRSITELTWKFKV